MMIRFNRSLVKSYVESVHFRRYVRIFFVLLLTTWVIYLANLHFGLFAHLWSVDTNITVGPMSVVIGPDNRQHIYHARTHPLIFIGGHPRSGTTLMRAMLDAHFKVRCGEETRILQHALSLRSHMMNPVEAPRLLQGGITEPLISSAISAFFLETIAQHGEPSEVLCNKDPLLLNHGAYISNELFPRSKWLFMVRDGRAVVHSIVSRKITITGYSNDDPELALSSWNSVVKTMNEQCDEIGEVRCMKVRYEDLILHPRGMMEKILQFLELPWDEDVMHHEDFINKGGEHGIRVSIRERSSDQIIKPLNLNALTQWVGTYDENVLKRMDYLAPMLKNLGYDPTQNPPNYGKPDPEVLEKTREIASHKQEWDEKSKKLLKDMEKQF